MTLNIHRNYDSYYQIKIHVYIYIYTYIEDIQFRYNVVHLYNSQNNIILQNYQTSNTRPNHS